MIPNLTYDFLFHGLQLDDSACILLVKDEEQISCYAYIPRFRYNSSTNSCEDFIYGGCGGNKNNYLDEESCVAACVQQ